MIPGIYEFGPCHSEMAYGGNSGNIEHRWTQHRRKLRNNKHHCAHLQNAWNLYGEDAFEFCILEVIEDSDERLAAEQKWLDIRHAEKTCYNIAITAGPAGPKSEEHKRKIGNANRGGKLPPFTEEHRHNMSVAKMGNQNTRGYKQTEEHKRKNSVAQMGNQRSKGYQNFLGHKHTDAAKRKLSKANSGENNPNWGTHPSEETRAKLSKARKRYWARKRAMAGLSLPVLVPNPSRPMLLWGGYRK